MAFDKDEVSQKLATWLKGRNGSDTLARALCYLALILIVLNLFIHQSWLMWLSLILLICAWWRIMSKNVSARRRENEWFVNLIGPQARGWLESPLTQIIELKNYRHASCPSCSQRVRLPRGKGNIRVTCPRCREKFTMKS